MVSADAAMRISSASLFGSLMTRMLSKDDDPFTVTGVADACAVPRARDTRPTSGTAIRDLRRAAKASVPPAAGLRADELQPRRRRRHAGPLLRTVSRPDQRRAAALVERLAALLAQLHGRLLGLAVGDLVR